MNSLLVIFSIFSNAIGRDVPADVRCIDARTNISLPAGAYLDAAEALAVVQLVDAYERGCTDKTLSLAAHRDVLQTEAEVKAGAAGVAAGAAPFVAVLLHRRRKRRSA